MNYFNHTLKNNKSYISAAIFVLTLAILISTQIEGTKGYYTEESLFTDKIVALISITLALISIGFFTHTYVHWKKNNNELKTYLIKKGKHYSGIHFGLSLFTRSIQKTVMFTESCAYRIYGENSLDINKLFGVSFGHHHVNSFRIGWRFNSLHEEIEIYSYCYNNGIREYIAICRVRINEEVYFKINFNLKQNLIEIKIKSKSLFSVNQTNVPFKFPFLKLGYKLYPYFGGQETAPHNVVLKIK